MADSILNRTDPAIAVLTSLAEEFDAKAAGEASMAMYQVHFVDHGGNIYATEHIRHEDDDAATEAAHRMHARSIGAGFDVWQDRRLVHRHCNGCSVSGA